MSCLDSEMLRKKLGGTEWFWKREKVDDQKLMMKIYELWNLIFRRVFGRVWEDSVSKQ